ncbi:hypothetical protein ES332_D08G188000v1 [Gossypium tomentosum]|uniref:Uncharacterized protein n=1 Tax=Gossypium tomentosum TaxID=34277 RepID=A0A5D2JVS5_GOSTO|nr:hypothetical protein ES332_D08G188000v1 [Gossypium tomentosum]
MIPLEGQAFLTQKAKGKGGFTPLLVRFRRPKRPPAMACGTISGDLTRVEGRR